MRSQNKQRDKVQMEEQEAEVGSKSEDLKLRTAIRCARAAVLLSSLGSPAKNIHQDQEEMETEMMMMREIKDLRMKLVRERMKIWRIKLRSLMELILPIVIAFISWTVLFVFAFRPL